MAAPITHVIFDVDGLLIDSERLYTVITEKILDEFGKSFTWELKSKQMGKKDTEAAKIIIDDLSLPLTIDEYIKKSKAMQEEIFPTTPLLPGAEKLVNHLHKHGVPMAIATGSSEKGIMLKTTQHRELFGLFQHAVYSSDDAEVKNGKPAPDCFIVCAKRFPSNPDPKQVLVFEDAINGLRAAHAANMACVWVPQREQDREPFKEMASCVLDSLEQFRPEDFGLPAFD